MSTVPAARPLPLPSALRAPRALARGASPEGPARILAAALLALILFAAFDHGAVGTAPGARVEVIICVLGAFGAGAWLLRTRELSLPLARTTLAGLALMLAFAVWSGITLAWSVAPDPTWLELNRVISYVLVLCLAVGLGAARRQIIPILADGFLIVASIVTLYALGQKLFPQFHVGSLLSLDQAGPIPRLQEPLGYWNALALFIALGVPIALFRAIDATRSPRARLVSVCVAQVMLVTLGFTLSRGGLLALVLALLIVAPLAGAGLRILLWSVWATVGALPPLILGLSLHSLTASGVSLSSRAGGGAILAGVLILAVAGLVFSSRQLLELERRTTLDSAARLRIKRALLVLLAGVVLIAVLALAVSSRGLGGQISHAWHSFTANPSGSVYDPQHLLSEDSEHRWVWWKEAAGAFGDRPFGGWGAGSFGVVHLLYRQDLLSVNQPHSLPLQFLAETGIVGALLALGALALLLRGAIRALRRTEPGSPRLAAAALLTGAVAFLLHCLYDWDWDIPGVALPALSFLGVLAGAARPDRPYAPHQNRSVLRPRTGVSGGLVGLLPAAVMLSVMAVSAAVPSIAAGNAANALVQAGLSGPGSLQQARADALLADRLDPLSDAGLKVLATIATRQKNLPLAESYLRQAIGRDPTDAQAWQQLAAVELLLGDLGDAASAAERALALDPHGLSSGAIAFEISQVAGLLQAQPRDSATAIVTPGRTASGAPAREPKSSTSPPATVLTPLVPGVNSSPTTPTQPPTTSSPPRPGTAPSRRPAGSSGTGRSSGGGSSGQGTTSTSTTPTSTSTNPSFPPVTTPGSGGVPVPTTTNPPPPPPH